MNENKNSERSHAPNWSLQRKSGTWPTTLIK
jgi:hypothetical protein